MSKKTLPLSAVKSKALQALQNAPILPGGTGILTSSENTDISSMKGNFAISHTVDMRLTMRHLPEFMEWLVSNMDGKWKLDPLTIDNSRGKYHYRPNDDEMETPVNIRLYVYDNDTLARIKLRWET